MVIKALFTYLAYVVVIYVVIASLAWKVRNPTANSMTVYTHIIDVIQFNKLAKFGGK